jgi:hypothetical protein
MIWNKHTHAWERGYAYAKAWHNLHGDLAIPATARFDGYTVGRWMRVHRLNPNLTEEQQQSLDALDPLWRWDPKWQRDYHRMAACLQAGGTLTGPRNRSGLGDDTAFRPGLWQHQQIKQAPAATAPLRCPGRRRGRGAAPPAVGQGYEQGLDLVAGRVTSGLCPESPRDDSAALLLLRYAGEAADGASARSCQAGPPAPGSNRPFPAGAVEPPSLASDQAVCPLALWPGTRARFCARNGCHRSTVCRAFTGSAGSSEEPRAFTPGRNRFSGLL